MMQLLDAGIIGSLVWSGIILFAKIKYGKSVSKENFIWFSLSVAGTLWAYGLLPGSKP